METYRTELTISNEGILTLKGLPFQVGDVVEVVIRSYKHQDEQGNRYPLRYTPIHYLDPFDSVAEDDWIAPK
jgi:hypothetical protein